MKLQALCDSDQCAFKYIKTGTRLKSGKQYDRVDNKYLGPQVKTVGRDAVACPDCKSALIWSRLAC